MLSMAKRLKPYNSALTLALKTERTTQSQERNLPHASTSPVLLKRKPKNRLLLKMLAVETMKKMRALPKSIQKLVLWALWGLGKTLSYVRQMNLRMPAFLKVCPKDKPNWRGQNNKTYLIPTISVTAQGLLIALAIH